VTDVDSLRIIESEVDINSAHVWKSMTNISGCLVLEYSDAWQINEHVAYNKPRVVKI
jgi:hypothetical protein